MSWWGAGDDDDDDFPERHFLDHPPPRPDPRVIDLPTPYALDDSRDAEPPPRDKFKGVVAPYYVEEDVDDTWDSARKVPHVDRRHGVGLAKVQGTEILRNSQWNPKLDESEGPLPDPLDSPRQSARDLKPHSVETPWLTDENATASEVVAGKARSEYAEPKRLPDNPPWSTHENVEKPAFLGPKAQVMTKEQRRQDSRQIKNLLAFDQNVERDVEDMYDKTIAYAFKNSKHQLLFECPRANRASLLRRAHSKQQIKDKFAAEDKEAYYRSEKGMADKRMQRALRMDAGQRAIDEAERERARSARRAHGHALADDIFSNAKKSSAGAGRKGEGTRGPRGVGVARRSNDVGSARARRPNDDDDVLSVCSAAMSLSRRPASAASRRR